MVKPVIVKRLVKGSHLTFTELDQNFQNLDDATISIAVQGSDTVVNDLNDTTTFVGQDGIQITATASNQTITFDASLYMDTTPVLSGDLDVNNFKIVNNVTNGNIELDPNGTGRVIISGDLQVDGTTTTINSTTLDVDDKNITLSKGAPNAAASDGGGITVEGPTTAATLLYASADDSWNFNKKTSAPELQIDNININGNDLTSTDTNGNIKLKTDGTGAITLDLSDLLYINGRSGFPIIESSNAGYPGLMLRSQTDYISYIRIHGGQNGDITIWPHGTGNVNMLTDTLRLGDNTENCLVTTYGSYDLTLNTNSGTSTGSIKINAGPNGDIAITPSGTGLIDLAGAIKTTATTGTPTNYENGYFEDMLATPVSWLKIRIGSSDYYLPLFQ